MENFKLIIVEDVPLEVSANYIITRNIADFEASVVSAIEPDEWQNKKFN